MGENGWRAMALNMAKGMAKHIARASTPQDLQQVGQALMLADEWRRQFELAMAEADIAPASEPTPQPAPDVVREVLEEMRTAPNTAIAPTLKARAVAALTALDAAPAEEVLGWGIVGPNGAMVYGRPYKSAATARQQYPSPDCRLVRLVAEGDKP